MAFVKWLIDKERRFAWSLIGAIVGILSLLIGFIALREKQPRIAIVVSPRSNVFDVHRPVRELSILFRGRNLIELDQNLSVFSVRIENTGGVDILQSYFDAQEPWGLRVLSGDLVEAKLSGANSEYLRRKLSAVKQSGNAIELQKPIFERHRYITLDIVVVHSRGERPSVEPYGKIAGIDHFEVVELHPQDATSVWRHALSGDLNVQAVRALVLWLTFLVIVLIVMLLSTPVVRFLWFLVRSRRRARVAGLLKRNPDAFERTYAELYIDGGRKFIRAAAELLKNPDKLRRHVEITKYLGMLRYPQTFDGWLHGAAETRLLLFEPTVAPAVKLMQGNIAIPRAGDVTIADGAAEALQRVADYLEIKLA